MYSSSSCGDGIGIAVDLAALCDLALEVWEMVEGHGDGEPVFAGAVDFPRSLVRDSQRSEQPHGTPPSDPLPPSASPAAFLLRAVNCRAHLRTLLTKRTQVRHYENGARLRCLSQL